MTIEQNPLDSLFDTTWLTLIEPIVNSFQSRAHDRPLWRWLDDNGKYLACRTVNEYFPSEPKEDGYIVNVNCKSFFTWEGVHTHLILSSFLFNVRCSRFFYPRNRLALSGGSDLWWILPLRRFHIQTFSALLSSFLNDRFRWPSKPYWFVVKYCFACF